MPGDGEIQRSFRLNAKRLLTGSSEVIVDKSDTGLKHPKRRGDWYVAINEAVNAGRLSEARALFARQADLHRSAGQLRAAAMCYELAGSLAAAQGAWTAAALAVATTDPAQARALLNEAEAVTRQDSLETWLAGRPLKGHRPISADTIALARRPSGRDWPFVRRQL